MSCDYLHFVKLPEWFSLSFVGAALALGVLVSVLHQADKKELAH